MPNADTKVSGLHAALRAGVQAMEMARGLTLKLAEPLTEDQLFARPCAGGNHGAWVLGHVASTEDYFLTSLGGAAPGLPASWEGLFGMNSKVDDDRSKYPSKAELLGALGERRAAIRAWFASLSEGELLEPIEGGLAVFASSRAMLASSLAFHEGFHAGQLSMARRAAGMAPLF